MRLSDRETSLNRDHADACAALGLHPICDPLGDGNHTDVPFSPDDARIGAALAYFLGTLFADVDAERSDYWYRVRTSRDEWSRVARALRIHGLAITDRGPPADV